MKVLDQHTIASAVRSIAPGYGVVKAYLFGSHARGDADAASDVDLCIEPDDGFTLFSLGGFGSHLEEALGVPVDVVCGDDSFSPRARERYERDRKLIYEKS